MAITYIQTPDTWTPINNDMIYYVQTNSEINNLYLEIYVQSSLVARIKLVVTDDGFAYCDIKQFLQSFTKNNQLYFDNTFWKALADLSYYVNYSVVCVETIGGEEYADNTRYAFNGQMSFVNFVEYAEQYNTSLSPIGKFLTNSPRVLKTDFLRTNFLSYINGSPAAVKIRVKVYENNNALPSNVYELDIDDLSALSGIIAISKASFGDELITWDEVTDLWENVESLWEEVGGSIINPLVTAAEICLLDTEGDEVTETFRYELDTYCSKYEKTNIYWQNSLGGFDSYTFNLVKRKRYNIERKDIQTNPYSFTNVGYSQHNGNVFNLANQNYLTNYTEGVILNSDLLTNEEHEWMWELIKAHSIYVEQIINDVTYYVPATIKATNYEPKITKVDGLQNITIELEYGYDNIKITK